jgi:hypothetical protein
VDEIAWDYPIFMVLAVAIGVTFFWFLTKSNRTPIKKDPQRDCPRCKLIVRGVDAASFRYCPFCGAKY